MTITIYGDSILKGILLSQGRYTVNREWVERFSQQYAAEIRNAAHMGCTIEKGVARMQTDMARGRLPGDYAVIAFGGNDCDFDWAAVAERPEAEHLCKTPAERFCTLYHQAVSLARQNGAQPVLVTLPPIDPEKYLAHICRTGLSRQAVLRWLGDVNAIYRWQEYYSRLVESVAAAEQTLLVDLRGSLLARRRLDGLVCDDGIHPSRQAQEIIFDCFCAAADRVLPRRHAAG